MSTHRQEIVDYSYVEALDEAFSREVISTDRARKLFPAHAEYIFDDTEGNACLDTLSLIANEQHAIDDELNQPVEATMRATAGRKSRKPLRGLLLIALWCSPLLLGAWVATTHMATTQSGFQNAASIAMGILIAWFGYSLLLLICAFRATANDTRHSNSEH